MEEIVLLRHCDLNSKVEKDIIAIKQQYWNYSYESQIEWMQNNLNRDDWHLLIYKDGQAIAYLNLVNITVLLDDSELIAVGIGNVCVSKNEIGRGYGRKIVLKANNIIKNLDKVGFLLCKTKLSDFYSKAGWREIVCDNISIAENDYDKMVMLFNSPIVKVHKLSIDRNF